MIKLNNNNKNRNEVVFLSITVSLVTSLTSFHSFMVKQELIVNKSIFGSFGFYMVSPYLLTTPFKMYRNSKKVVLKRDVLSWWRRIFSKQGEKRRQFQFQIILFKIMKKNEKCWNLIARNKMTATQIMEKNIQWASKFDR